MSIGYKYNSHNILGCIDTEADIITVPGYLYL